MTRDEAIEWLQRLLRMAKEFQQGVPVFQQEIEQTLAALEAPPDCACGGRGPLAVIEGYVIRQDWERFVEDPDSQFPYIYRNPTASPCVAIRAPLLPREVKSEV